MSIQNLRSFQAIQEFKIFPRSWQDNQDVERWERKRPDNFGSWNIRISFRILLFSLRNWKILV